MKKITHEATRELYADDELQLQWYDAMPPEQQARHRENLDMVVGMLNKLKANGYSMDRAGEIVRGMIEQIRREHPEWWRAH